MNTRVSARLSIEEVNEFRKILNKESIKFHKSARETTKTFPVENEEFISETRYIINLKSDKLLFVFLYISL